MSVIFYKLFVKLFADEEFYEYIELAIQLQKFRSSFWRPSFRDAGEKLILDEMDRVWKKLNWMERKLIRNGIDYAILQE